MTHHTITAVPKVKFTFPGLAEGESETAYPTLEITYSYRPGRPAYTPRGEYAPIDPPTDAELELVSVKLIDGDGLDPTYSQIEEWAQDWLEDEGFGDACANAEDWLLADADDAYDRMRDERA